jgi:hypothetical protein
MKLDEAKKIVSIVGTVGLGNSFRNLLLARKVVKLSESVHSEWTSEFQRRYDPLPDIHKETTYDGCVPSRLTLTPDNKFLLSLEIYDGNFLDGYPMNIRCSFEIIFNEIVDEMIPHLNQAIEDYAIDTINREDRIKYNNRLKSTINKLLISK